MVKDLKHNIKPIESNLDVSSWCLLPMRRLKLPSSSSREGARAFFCVGKDCATHTAVLMQFLANQVQNYDIIDTSKN